MEPDYWWQPASYGDVPAGAVPHGYEHNGEPIYACRVETEDGVRPGQVRRRSKGAYVAWDGEEAVHLEYEVLMNRGVWGIDNGGGVPPDAYPAGEDDEGRPLYLARAAAESGSLHLGLVRPDSGGADIVDAEEDPVHAYEVLLRPDPAAAERQETEARRLSRPVLRFASSSAPPFTVYLDRGEEALPEQVSWADTDGTEYAITVDEDEHTAHGHRRTAGAGREEFRSELAGRDKDTPDARRFLIEQTWDAVPSADTRWSPSEELLLVVGETGHPPVRLSWRDTRGNQGDLTFHGDTMGGTYSPAGQPPAAIRGRGVRAALRHGDMVLAVAAGTAEGRPVFASGSSDDRISLWDAATGEPMWTVEARGLWAGALVFAGDVLVSSGSDGVVARWDAATGAPYEPLHRAPRSGGAVAATRIGDRILVAGAGKDRRLRVWDVVSGELHADFDIGGVPRRVALSTLDGRPVALTVGDTAVVWDLAAGVPLRPLMPLREEGAVGAFGILNGRPVVVHGRPGSPGEDTADPAQNGWYKRPDRADLNVYDLASGEVLSAFTEPGRPRNDAVVMLEHAGRPLVFSAGDTKVTVWDPTTGEQLVRPHLGVFRAGVVDLAATHVDGRVVLAAGVERRLIIWSPDELV